MSGQTEDRGGWVIYHRTEQLTDIFRAREIPGGNMCLHGDFPPALFNVGSESELDEYSTKLIGTVGNDGA